MQIWGFFNPLLGGPPINGTDFFAWYTRNPACLHTSPIDLIRLAVATLRAARLLTGRFVAHRLKTTLGILPLRFAPPTKIRSSATTPVTDLVYLTADLSEVQPSWSRQ